MKLLHKLQLAWRLRGMTQESRQLYLVLESVEVVTSRLNTLVSHYTDKLPIRQADVLRSALRRATARELLGKILTELASPKEDDGLVSAISAVSLTKQAMQVLQDQQYSKLQPMFSRDPWKP